MEYLKLWKNQLDKLRECTAEEKGLILEACMAYQDGEEVTFPEGADGRFLRLLWQDFKAMLDANARKQQTNAENGAKGGRPRNESEENPGETQEKPSENPAETQRKPTETKKQETGNTKQEGTTGASHTEKAPPQVMDARAREGVYIDPGGKERPRRYDTAWKTSIRARGAVCQRVIERISPGMDMHAAGDLHGYLMDAMQSGVPPEWIEDAAAGMTRATQLLAALSIRQQSRARPVEVGA